MSVVVRRSVFLACITLCNLVHRLVYPISKLLLHSPPSISMKVPSIVSEAKRALSEEFAVVIGLQTTGEVR